MDCIDVLYIKGVQSPNKDLELLYSLRSLAKHGKNFNRVFITGKRPSFVKNVIHTPCNDIGCRTINHWWKVTQTILNTDISDNFLLMYDDIFFLKDVNLSEYPFYNRGDLSEHNTGTQSYMDNLREAQKVLKKLGKSTLDYTLHTPCIYNKDNFLKLGEIYQPYMSKSAAPSVRCIYGNLFVGDSPYREDLKLRVKSDKVRDEDCFSISDEMFANVKDLLDERFSERCEYENSILY